MYGIEVWTTIEHIKQIGENNGNWSWQDSIDKEMKNVSVASEIIDHGEPNPVGWAQSSGYLIFDVKNEWILMFGLVACIWSNNKLRYT